MVSRIKQQYHLEPDRGLLNDPNGLVYFLGKYYVFFQWNRFEKNHSYKEWGLFTSSNLIHWDFTGSAIIPDQNYDLQGVYSGSGYVIDHKLYLYYTGNSKKDGIRRSRQCLVISEDGRHYCKEGILLETPMEYTEHFRDPKVWGTKESGYFMIVGGQQINGKGAIALSRSVDGRSWKYSHLLAASEQYEMIECPDLFSLNGRDILLYNPQKRNLAEDRAELSFSVYKLVEFCEDTGRLQEEKLDQGWEKLDDGFDFYAPQTFLDLSGRRILFAWMSRMEEEAEHVFAQQEPNIHCLTLPRELYLEEDRLCQRPVKELYTLLGDEIPSLQDSQHVTRLYPLERTFYLRIGKIEVENDLNLNLHSGEVTITYLPKRKKLVLYRYNWLDGSKESKECEGYPLKEIEIWSDYSSIEIFINGGERVMSSRIFPMKTKSEVVITGVGAAAEIQANEVVTDEIIVKR